MKTSKKLSNSSFGAEIQKSSCCFKSLASCFRSNSIDIDKFVETTPDNIKSGSIDYRGDTNYTLNNLSEAAIPQEKSQNQMSTSEQSLKTDIALKSALLIQRWYRRYQSRIEMRKLTAWNIYQSIEYSGEQDQLKLYDFFLTLIKNRAIINNSGEEFSSQSSFKKLLHLPERKLSDGSVQSESLLLETNELSIDNETKPLTTVVNKVLESDLEYMKTKKNKKRNQEITVDSSYKGAHITLPITKTSFHDLVNSFKLNKPLHAKFVVLILEETIKVLKKLKNINIIPTNVSKNITVVGDLHGQLDDMLLIFYKNGLPSDDNPYLFNGDFVDRGAKSIEVSLIIFCGFLMSQSAVYINRGNHEDHVMNNRWLPLASLIDQKIYVVHGGISDRTLLKDIYNIKREKYASVLKPPILNDDGEMVKDLTIDDVLEWRQVLDALWSDPKKTPGIQPNSFRGGGCLFGQDVTEEIMERNELSLIIRSHECKENGYEYTHDNKILTIFSASNYYEYGSNNGAYAKITSSNSKPIIVQFYCNKEENVTKYLSLRERVNGIEVSAIKHLLEKFAANKKRLLYEYKLKDKDNKGAISLNDWCTVTGEVLELKLPWRILRSRLAKLNKDGLVLYDSTFEGLSIPNLNQTNDENISETLYRHKDILESIFRAIDKDHSGQISREEFRDCCKLVNEHDPSALFSDNSIEDIANTMDIDKDGFINLNEFLEAFRLVSSKY